jgi:hypothetical protein
MGMLTGRWRIHATASFRRLRMAHTADGRRDEANANSNANSNSDADADQKEGAMTKHATVVKRSPWRHFQAFGSMDEYVDLTLIQYDNSTESPGRRE